MNTDKKRRNFIQATLMTPLAVGVTDASGRIHGTPSSIDPAAGAAIQTDKFILPLAHAGIPAEALTDLSKVSALVDSILTEDGSATAFFANPGRHFEQYGLDGSDATLVDPIITMLVALTDPSVKDALNNRNYALMFDCMSTAGVFEPRDPSLLQGLIQNIIAEHITEIRKAIGTERRLSSYESQNSYFIEILRSSGVTASEEDLAAVAYLLSPGHLKRSEMVSSLDNSASRVAVVLLLIVAAVLVVAVVITEVSVVGIHPIVMSSLNGELTKLDLSAMRNMRRAYRMAEITGDGQIQLHARREAIKEEVTAILTSLLNLQLIKIPKKNMSTVIDAVYRYACKTAGVPSHAN